MSVWTSFEKTGSLFSIWTLSWSDCSIFSWNQMQTTPWTKVWFPLPTFYPYINCDIFQRRQRIYGGIAKHLQIMWRIHCEVAWLKEWNTIACYRDRASFGNRWTWPPLNETDQYVGCRCSRFLFSSFASPGLQCINITILSWDDLTQICNLLTTLARIEL